MIKKESQFIVGLINQAINVLCPFLITVIGLKYTSAEIGSIWLIFLSMTILVNLFDFGLSPTIIRNVSYVINGARVLAKDGLENVEFKAGIDYSLLKRLLIDIKKIYRMLSFIAFIIIFLGGGGYFYYISPMNNLGEVVLSWMIFSTGLLISLYYLYYTPVLCGLGVIQKAYLANIIGRLAWLILTLIIVIFTPSLFTLSLSFLASVIINRVVIQRYYVSNVFIKNMNGYLSKRNSTVPFIAHNAIKLGVVSLGSFLISRATVLIAGASLPLVLVGEYTFSIQIFMALLAVGNVFVTVKIPELSKLVMLRDNKNIRLLIIRVISISLSFYVAGFIVFYLSQSYLTEAFGTKIGFLEKNELTILAIIYFLELTHSICATILTTSNKIPFVWSSLISGALIIVGAYTVMKFNSEGVLGLILVQGAVQLLYNNWKWPLSLYKEHWKNN
ncbi:hypothetical protein NQU91_07715 [Aeromonas hydrophila]|uniref:O-unit flippase-like protein n=1 Tax=Aeromonas TaxID=642 RepID=UPI00211D4205|nr:hypothetical protein NQU91_07715 [Aeromonas hydrophila]